jgi:hypothetical protein
MKNLSVSQTPVKRRFERSVAFDFASFPCAEQGAKIQAGPTTL